MHCKGVPPPLTDHQVMVDCMWKRLISVFIQYPKSSVKLHSARLIKPDGHLYRVSSLMKSQARPLVGPEENALEQTAKFIYACLYVEHVAPCWWKGEPHFI